LSDLVVDSSVVAKWVLLEADSADAQLLLAETATHGGLLVVLDLALVEVANAIWKRQLRKLVSTDEARRLLDVLLRLPVQIEPAGALLPQALDIACRHGRAVYDALFVALAEKKGLQGVTADEPLYNIVHSEFPQIMLLRHWRPSVSP
jgi:predicted nucleic acid-binding protein